MPVPIYVIVLSAIFLAFSASGAWAQDSAETVAEQSAAIAAETNPPAGAPAGEAFRGAAGPLLVGVDDIALGAFRIDVVSNVATQAFTGAEVWGAAYDPANNRVLFNSGSTLWEWPVGGAVNSLGTITDAGAISLSMTGLAFGNDTLYACRNIANEAIYSIDLNTLVATVFIDYDDNEFDCGGLAFNPADGMLYMTNDDATPFGSGLFRMNMDGTGTLIAAYPPGQTDIDGLAIGDGRAYLVIDEPGDLYVWDFALSAYQAPLTSPFVTAEIFSAGAWIGGASPVADLAITKTDGVTSATPGTDTVYSIVASNIGPADVTGATLGDTFPAACSTVSWTCVGAGGGVCAASGNGNIDEAVDLPSGASVTFTATCSISPVAGGTLDNTATITAPVGVTDPDAANNSASDNNTLEASADVSVTKVATSVPVPLLLGSNIVYELTAGNAGPSSASSVVVSDSLPSQLNFVSTDCGASFAAPNLTWNVGTLAPGANAVCNLTVEVAGTGPISNTASISSAASDPDSANDSSTAVLAGAEVTDLAITLNSNAPAGLTLGDSFIYTVTGTNNGPGAAFGIDFSMDLPPNLNFVSSNCSAVLAGSTLSWSVASLANGASSECQVSVSVVLSGTIAVSAAISSATFDANLANNSVVLGLIAEAVPIPAQSILGLLLLAMMSLVIGMLALRRT